MSRTHNLNIKANYKVEDIITALLKNKEEHIKDYKKAIQVYMSDLLNAFEVPLAKLEKGLVPDLIPHNFGLNQPRNEEKSYDNMIKLFQSMTDNVVELDMDDANGIFNDEWDWAVSSKILNSTYSSRG